MTYYKVPAKLDQKNLYRMKNGKRYANGYFLIGGELLTETECRKINAPIEQLEKVQIKKTECYRLFGARFAN